MTVSRIDGIRELRRRQTAECFTPTSLTNEILDKLTCYSYRDLWEDETKTFLDPAVGNGNLLLPVLQRKIEVLEKAGRLNSQTLINALSSIYGIDIMRDDIRECRLRLLKEISKYDKITEEHIRIVFKHIIFLNRKRYPNGALDYDFSFSYCTKKEEDINEWLLKINNGEFDVLDLPVEESFAEEPYNEIFGPTEGYINKNEEQEKRE